MNTQQHHPIKPKLRAALATSAAAAALSVGILANPSVALAGSGDFIGCDAVHLASAATCWGPDLHTWVETEGTAALDDGSASCTGVGTGSGNSPSDWYAYTCVPVVITGPNNSWCTFACLDVTGHGFVHNHGVWTDYFTGWGDYSS